MLRPLATPIAAFLLLLGGCSAAGTEPMVGEPDGPRLALLPLQGMKAPVEEVRRLRQLLREAFVAELGEQALVPDDEIERTLSADRIRVVDTFPLETAAHVSASLGGARLITSTLIYARLETEPTAALLLRSYDSEGYRLGSRLWLHRGSQDEDLFALGGSEDFTALFERATPGIAEDALDDVRQGRPGEWPRIAVIPFESNYDHPDSGPLAGVLAAHLLEDDFEVAVIEPGDLNLAFQQAGIRYLRLTRSEDVQRIGRAASARWLLTGVVLDFELSENPAVPSAVSVLIRVFDVERGRTVATTLAQHSSDEGEILFGAGMPTHPILNLAEAIRSGLDDLESTWQGS